MPQLQFANQLTKLTKEELFIHRGVVDLSQYIFLDSDEIDELKNWLLKQKNLAVLKLQGCYLCERQSIRSLFVDDIYAPQQTNVLTRSLQSLGINKSVKYTKSDALAKLLAQQIPWLEIDFSQNNLAQKESDVILKSIASFQKKLRHLNVSFNVVGDAGIDELCAMLMQQHTSLKTLKLQRCSLTTKHLEKIILVLKNNKFLREIDLRENDFDNATLNSFLTLLDVNSTLVDIQIPVYDLDKDKLQTFQQKLKSNQTIRENLHKQLLSEELLTAQAFVAVKLNDVAWFNILIGLENKSRDELTNFELMQPKLFINMRKLGFFVNILVDQLEELKEIKPADLLSKEKLSAANKKLKQVIGKNCKLEIEIYRDFYLDKVKNDYQEGALLDKKFLKRRIKEFSTAVIGPCLKVVKLKLNKKTDLESLKKLLKDRIDKAYEDVEFAKMAHDKLQVKHTDYLVRRYQLLESVKSLELNRELSQEREELEEKLIESHIDPNAIDNWGNTLLHVAFTYDRHVCVKILLENGANILLPNTEGVSVFNLLLNAKEKTKSGQIIIHFIQKRIDKIWFDLVSHRSFHKEIPKLTEIKKILDGYLKTLLEKIEMPLLFQVLTGVYHHLHERKQELEKYYSQIMTASKQHERNPLAQILVNMFEISQGAKRGLRESSSLHDSVEKKVLPLLTQVTTSYYELRPQLELLEHKHMNGNLEKPKPQLDAGIDLIDEFEIIESNSSTAKIYQPNKLEFTIHTWWKKLVDHKPNKRPSSCIEVKSQENDAHVLNEDRSAHKMNH